MKKTLLIIGILVMLTCLTLTAFAAEDVFEEGSVGKWYYWTKINPMDDTTSIWFALDCEIPTYSKSYPTLVLRRLDGKTELTIRWRKYLSDNTKVTYRFDEEKAIKETWNGSTNNTQTFYPGGSKAVIKFIQRLMTVDKFTIQITPYGEGKTIEVFDIRGLKNVVEEFNDTLGWIEEGE